MRTIFTGTMFAYARATSLLANEGKLNIFEFHGAVHGDIIGFRNECPNTDSEKPMEFATFNAFMVVGFDRDFPSEQRREVTTAGIVDIDADVLCLQEIYTPDDIEYVISQLKAPTSPWADGDIFYEYVQEMVSEAPCSSAEDL